MTKLSFGQRLVVTRVLGRYAEQRVQIDLNRRVLAALEKWIDRKPKVNVVDPAGSPQPI